jgi:CheY-specific phosphatase CheX
MEHSTVKQFADCFIVSANEGFCEKLGSISNSKTEIKLESPARSGIFFMLDISGQFKRSKDNIIEYKGHLNISMDQQTCLKICEKILKVKVTEITYDNLSGCSELSNLILGRAKHLLNELGYFPKLDIPKVMMANQFQSILPNKSIPVALDFQTTCGDIHLDLYCSHLKRE